MSGSGVKSFQSFEVLAAADVNNYLMQQSVMVFADATARDAALTAASVTAAAGMTCYLSSTGNIYTYTGSNWVQVSGLAPIVPSVSPTVGSGSATVNADGSIDFSGVSYLQILGVFSASYRNYKILLDVTARSTNSTCSWQLVTSGGSVAATAYDRTVMYNNTATTAATSQALNTTTWLFDVASTALGRCDLTLMQPFDTAVTSAFGQITNNTSATSLFVSQGVGYHATAASYTGFRITATAGNFTVRIRIYGYN